MFKTNSTVKTIFNNNYNKSTKNTFNNYNTLNNSHHYNNAISSKTLYIKNHFKIYSIFSFQFNTKINYKKEKQSPKPFIPKENKIEEDRDGKVRLNKAISFRGFCSRRKAIEYAENGKVKVDGVVVKNPNLFVSPFSTDIEVCGVKLRTIIPKYWKPKIWVHHKLPGVLTAKNKDDDRASVIDTVKEMIFGPDSNQHLISVGRLDYNSEGLLLLTTDGELARELERPEHTYERKYCVTINGFVTNEKVEALKRGVAIEGYRFQPMNVDISTTKRSKGGYQDPVITLGIKEGKNREIRRIFEAFSWQVAKLKRISYGPYSLGDLPPGAVIEVPIKDQLLVWYESHKKKLKDLDKQNKLTDTK